MYIIINLPIRYVECVRRITIFSINVIVYEHNQACIRILLEFHAHSKYIGKFDNLFSLLFYYCINLLVFFSFSLLPIELEFPVLSVVPCALS